jgi:ABC-type uncharacterized transport system YnjBCD ATPase subunit
MAANGSDTVKVAIKNLSFYYGSVPALKEVTLNIKRNKVTAIIGPSGCGKSTLLRVLNRIYEIYPHQRAEGEVLMDGQNILSSEQDLNLLRAKVGMVFQKPTPFPMTIFDNVAFGIDLYEKLPRSEMQGRVETALRRAALWEEVKDKLNASGTSLGWPATALVHRALRRNEARSDFAGRTLLGPGPDIDCENRRADRGACRRLYDRARNAQHAAGITRFRLHRFHVPGRARRIRRNRKDFHQAVE